MNIHHTCTYSLFLVSLLLKNISREYGTKRRRRGGGGGQRREKGVGGSMGPGMKGRQTESIKEMR